MKITYRNEGVRLPSKSPKNITLDDIQKINLQILKKEITQKINNTLIRAKN